MSSICTNAFSFLITYPTYAYTLFLNLNKICFSFSFSLKLLRFSHPQYLRKFPCTQWGIWERLSTAIAANRMLHVPDTRSFTESTRMVLLSTDFTAHRPSHWYGSPLPGSTRWLHLLGILQVLSTYTIFFFFSHILWLIFLIGYLLELRFRFSAWFQRIPGIYASLKVCILCRRIQQRKPLIVTVFVFSSRLSICMWATSILSWCGFKEMNLFISTQQVLVFGWPALAIIFGKQTDLLPEIVVLNSSFLF